MKTTEEIIARIERDKNKFMDFSYGALIELLPFEAAKPYLQDDAKEEDWKPPATREERIEYMRSYMEFAWGKVEDHRGISANRSVEKFEAWVWALGDEDTHEAINACSYSQYGAPVLKLVSERYGFPIPNGEWVERMARGEPCVPDCQDGCGR